MKSWRLAGGKITSFTVFKKEKKQSTDNEPAATERNITRIVVKCSISGIVGYLAGALLQYTLCSCNFLQLFLAPSGCRG